MHNLKTILIFALFCIIGLIAIPYAQVVYSGDVSLKTKHIKGEFDVAMESQTDDEFAVGRMTLDKTYHGDLHGFSKGQMLSHVTNVKGSAGYVAMESFNGSLDGKKGGFVLMHQGIMDKGAQSLEISVIPDSGSDELTGISGKMSIEIVDGKHFYLFDYTLP